MCPYFLKHTLTLMASSHVSHRTILSAFPKSFWRSLQQFEFDLELFCVFTPTAVTEIPKMTSILLAETLKHTLWDVTWYSKPDSHVCLHKLLSDKQLIYFNTHL